MNLSLFVWILLNLAETVVCFYLAAGVMSGLKAAGHREKLVRIVLFVVAAVLTGGSYRIGSVFSEKVFIFSALVPAAGACLAYRRKPLLIIGTVLSYCSSVKLLEWLLVFFLSFLHAYREPGSAYNSFTNVNEQFIAIRVAVLVAVSFIVYRIRRSDLIRQAAEYRRYLMAAGVIMSLLALEYSRLLEYGFLYSSSDLPVIRTVLRDSLASMLTSAALLAVLGALYLKNQTIRSENSFLLMKEELESRKYEEMSSALEQNRELIHDTRNHYLVISEYEKNGEYDKLHRYVEELRNNFVSVTPDVYTGNRILDLILSQKRITARKKEIEFEICAVPLSHLPFTEQEICSLFGNLLDNAVEACEKVEGRREIQVNIKKQNQMLCIEISNSAEKKPVQNGRHFLSWKKDKKAHGFGLRSVERIVDAHEGLVSYEPEDDRFTVTVTLFDTE